MDQQQRVGGVAALTAAATFVVGIGMFVSLLSDYTTGDPTPGESVAFLVDHQATLYVWNVVIFIVFGIALVPLVLVLHERLRNGSPLLGRTATAFGLIWAGLVLAAGMVTNIGIGTVADLHETDPARAETVWTALDSVQNGLGGGNEIAGGLWVLLVSMAALRGAGLPTGLNYLGILCGIAGLVTVVPPLEPVGAVFGVGLIIWFIWAGLVLFRQPPNQFAGTGEAMRGLSELP
ncbi:MAG: DUF4386 family protein [Acidimicrobiales bacterium]